MLCDKIRLGRENLKWSQAKLGEYLSVSQQAVGKWEKGVAEPDSDTLKRIAHLYNVSLDYLLGNTSNDTEQSYLVPAPQLDGLYYKMAKEAQEAGITPEDAAKIIELYRKYKK